MADDLIERPWRCDVTGNPVGTDTWGIGYTCDCQGCRAADALSSKDKALEELRAELERARAALAPFAKVAELDIGSDEADMDAFRPMSRLYSRAPTLLVSDFRAAARAQAEGETP